MHVHFPDHHGEGPESGAGASLAWELDNVELVTVGVDIGSSTSHLVFGRVHLQRRAQSLSSRYQVVHREVLNRSPVVLTPFRADGLIDVEALGSFVSGCYAEAGLDAAAVDTGAVILTGAALERANARAVADLFAARGGGFVCATAGHNLEALLAAHGSGAVARSRSGGGPLLHVDIGGGTSKLALVVDGEVVATAACAVGGRLVVLDGDGRVVRCEAAARLAGSEAGVALDAGCRPTASEMERVAGALAGVLVETSAGPPRSVLGRRLLLTEPLPAEAGAVRTWSCSGGVAEYLAGREDRRFGDMAMELSRAIADAALSSVIRLEPVADGIRATALGASQFTVQLSGNTVQLPPGPALPVHNLPVVRVVLPGSGLEEAAVAAAVGAAFRRLDLVEGGSPVAIALAWRGEPHYRELRALASGVVAALPRTLADRLPIVLACESDVGRSLGAILVDELGVASDVVAIDGLDLLELDFIDVGAVLEPAGVVPVVIKSLAFPEAVPAAE